MDIFMAASYFILGTIIGSFLNVVVLRYNSGFLLQKRSGCFSCGKTLRWYELVPLISYIFLRGRCSSCRSRISLQYPVVELLAGFLFLGIYLKEETVYSMFFWWIVFSLFLIILVYDIRHKIIPNGIVYSLILLSFIGLFIDYSILEIRIPTTVEIFSGPLLFLPFFFLWLISRGRWMGLGDAKLAVSMGWLLGLRAGFSAVIFGFWFGAAVGLFLLLFPKTIQFILKIIVGKKQLFLIPKHFTIKSEVPFAPFLILGTAVVYFFELNITSLSNLF